MMAKRDFEAIANAIAGTYAPLVDMPIVDMPIRLLPLADQQSINHDGCDDPQECFNGDDMHGCAVTDFSAGYQVAIGRVARAIADVCEHANPNFDHARFLKACGVN